MNRTVLSWALMTQLIGEGHLDFLRAAAFSALMTRVRPG
jgi:hypothetical protein